MIEEVENDIRGSIESNNIRKSQEIVDNCRISPVLGKPNMEGANKLKEVWKSQK